MGKRNTENSKMGRRHAGKKQHFEMVRRVKGLVGPSINCTPTPTHMPKITHIQVHDYQVDRASGSEGHLEKVTNHKLHRRRTTVRDGKYNRNPAFWCVAPNPRSLASFYFSTAHQRAPTVQTTPHPEGWAWPMAETPARSTLRTTTSAPNTAVSLRAFFNERWRRPTPTRDNPGMHVLCGPAVELT